MCSNPQAVSDAMYEAISEFRLASAKLTSATATVFNNGACGALIKTWTDAECAAFVYSNLHKIYVDHAELHGLEIKSLRYQEEVAKVLDAAVIIALSAHHRS